MTWPLTFSVPSGASVEAYLAKTDDLGALTAERRDTGDARGSYMIMLVLYSLGGEMEKTYSSAESRGNHDAGCVWMERENMVQAMMRKKR